MKNVFKNLILIFLIGLFAACQNPSKTSNSVYFSEGWWKFSTLNTSVYLEYDANKNITRAGTEEQEYAPSILESIKKGETYQWDMCVKNSQMDSRIKFEKVNDADRPEWVTKKTLDQLYEELIGDYVLDKTFVWKPFEDETISSNTDFWKNLDYLFLKPNNLGYLKYYSYSEELNTSTLNSSGVFNWEITENGKISLKLANRNGHYSSISDYSFDGEKIVFEDFLGMKNVTATKKEIPDFIDHNK